MLIEIISSSNFQFTLKTSENIIQSGIKHSEVNGLGRMDIWISANCSHEELRHVPMLNSCNTAIKVQLLHVA